MKKHLCPNCSAPSFTIWQKLGLSPLRKVQCKSCGAYVTVPWAISLLLITFTNLFAFAAALVAFIALPTSGFSASAVTAVLALATGSVFFLWLYQRVVPLIVKQK